MERQPRGAQPLGTQPRHGTQTHGTQPWHGTQTHSTQPWHSTQTHSTQPRHGTQYLCEVQLQLLAMEVTLVELYPSSRRSLGLAEVDPHSAEALEQLERDLVIIEGEQSFEPLLRGGDKGDERTNTPLTGSLLKRGGR